MERINKFLAKRPLKHKKVIKFHDKSYDVTKEDLKLVKAYRANKCLDKTFDVSRSYPLTNREKITPIVCDKPKRSPDSELAALRRAKRGISKIENKIRAIKMKESERGSSGIVVDSSKVLSMWNDNLDDYKQEWIYSIRTSYEGSIEACRYTEDHLAEDVERQRAKYFKPRPVKEKSLADLLPKKVDAEKLLPFPRDVGKEWRIHGRKRYGGGFLYSVDDGSITVYNLKLNKPVMQYNIGLSIRVFRVNVNGVALFSDGLRLWRLCDGFIDELLFSDMQVRFVKTSFKNTINENSNCIENSYKQKSIFKDIGIDEDYFCILRGRMIDVYSLKGGDLVKRFIVKHENPHMVRMVRGRVYVGTANGIMAESPDGDIKMLNYVIDFYVRGRKIVAVTNLKRMVEISSGYMTKTMIQGKLARKIKMHPLLNLTAVLFYDEIVIYKKVEDEYVTVQNISGTFQGIFWDEKMPWLYACKNSRVQLFT